MRLVRYGRFAFVIVVSAFTLTGVGLRAQRLSGAVMQFPGVYLYGGDNELYKQFDLRWCQFPNIGTVRDEFDEGDVWLSDRSFQMFGPYLGKGVPLPNLSGVVYDDGSLRVENVRKTDHDELTIAKYSDHIHYRVHLRANCLYSAHRYIRIHVRGRKVPPTYTISGNTGVPGVKVATNGQSVVSDLSGAYSIPNLAAGTYLVFAEKSECAVTPPLHSVTVGPAATATNFETACASEPSWQLSAIAGLPPGIYNNSIWARNRNEAFVFGTLTAPTDGAPQSFLFRSDGASWKLAFFAPHASSIAVFGTGDRDVFISMYAADTGRSLVYRSIDNGVTWFQQSLPSEVENSWIGVFAGTPNNIQAGAGGNRIVRFDGNSWTVLEAGGTMNNDAPGPMTFLSPSEGYYATCWGFGAWDGSSWSFHANGFDFCDVSSVWGMRDTAGNLVLYAAGNNNFSNGVRVWAFNGFSFGSKCGYVFGDPTNGTFICNGVLAGNGSYGYATGIWGSAPDNVWVTAKLGYPLATGRIYNYNGASWMDLTDSVNAAVGQTLPATTAFAATGPEDLWVALADGRILRYTAVVPPQLRIMDDASTPTHVFVTGTHFTPGGPIDMHLLDPRNGELVYRANPADSAGLFNSYSFAFANCCDGIYYVWAVDVATNRASNAVRFTVPVTTAGPLPPKSN